MSDRTVHASNALGDIEVVRYDKAGKWYCEIKEAERYHIGVHQAADQALSFLSRGGTIYTGLPGGKTFDRIVAERHVRP